MSSKPLVSGIIIFRNTQKFIEEAIQSVFVQTYDNWELLLVDDGSTDGSREIAQSYAIKYPEKVRYLEHENHQNLGVSAARNLGVARAKGDYIAFLGADAVWLPHKLQQQIAILESIPQAAMLYGRTLRWYSWTCQPEYLERDCLTDLAVEHNILVQPPNLIALFLEKEDTIPSISSVLICRKVFDKLGGFEESFRDRYADMVFYTKVLLHFPVFVSGQCWDRYRDHKYNTCCVAKNTAKLNFARTNPAREIFLKWIEEYLYQHSARYSDAWDVLQQQLFPYRYPQRYEMIERSQHLLRQIKGIGQRIGQLTLPDRLHHWLRFQQHKRQFHQQRHNYISQVGWVRFGDLRRVTPIESDFGRKRGKPIDQYYIEKFLKSHTDDIQGWVLEISDNYYTSMFGGDRVTKSDVMQVIDGPLVNIVADLTDCSEEQIASNTYDCIILTQTLPFIYDVRAALKTLYRILKPKGVLLTTFAGISQINPEDVELWGEYWRFTKLSSGLLFEEFFPPEHLTVEAYGNVFTAITFLHGFATEELRQEELDYHDPNYEVLIAVRAVKPND